MVHSSIVAWSDHKAFLLAGFRDLWVSGRNSDLEIKCGTRSFRVHKLIVNLFTDYFSSCDGLWVRVSASADHIENVLKFFYLGQMEGFLLTCKLLGVRLFKGEEINAEGMRRKEKTTPAQQQQQQQQQNDNDEEDEDDDEEDNNEDRSFQVTERYELSDFQLVCRNCYKCFPDEKALKKHTWGCTRDKVFQCKFCDRRFRFRNDVQHHELSHTGEKPYKCTFEGCTKDFKLKSGLVFHMKSTHENVRYKCDECDLEFRSKTGRRAHKASIHTKERPWGCMDCGKSFATKPLLQTHQKTAHGSKKRKKAETGTDDDI